MAGLTYNKEKALDDDATMQARRGLEVGTGSRKSGAETPVIV
jgi:hypothetical protein